MITAQVLDTHRLMYRNARLRAISLSDRTTPIQFLNVTDEDTVTQIGDIVYTDSCGYIFYGAEHRRVSCLAVGESAIIQVDLHNNNNWNDIEWIVRVEDDSQFVRVDDVGKVYDKNGNLLWNPLTGDWSFPDFMRRDEFTEGEWAEGEMNVTAATPKVLNVDKWTHTITVQGGHANEYELSVANGRAGQCIVIVNASDTAVTITETHAGGSSSQTITASGAILAVRSLSANQWVLRSFDAGEAIIGTRTFLLQRLTTGGYNTWIPQATGKLNDSSGVIAHDADGEHDLPPRSIAFTGSGNKYLYPMPTDGLIEAIINPRIVYSGDGVWHLSQMNIAPSPAHIAKVPIDGSAFPADHQFGSYSGINDLHIDLQMVAGEVLHVFITVPASISFGASRVIRIYVNGCKVLELTTATLYPAQRLVSGRIELGYDAQTNDRWYFWTADSEAEKAQ